ncbi:LysR family transcriptional regulator [Yersinia aldovae]|uniref:LysR family transcriptional regulator n=1 Tax=Yersinia aldovae TaxID=29483 RepID=UPI00119D92FD|nr:LysR family transcriptional regulator [Yersinia aldovae]
MKSELNSIPVFVTVAEAGSFSRAAEKLHLTRSAVTKIIARLEAKLGVTLFHRTTRSLSMTDEGALYHEYCQRALNEICLVEEILNDGKFEVCGRLRVSVPVLFGHLCIAPLLTLFADTHPKLKLEISFSDRAVDLVEEGFDLAIRIGALPDSSSLIARKLSEHRMIYCAAPDYLHRCGEPQTAEELNLHAAVAYIRSRKVQRWQFRDKTGTKKEFIPNAKLMMDDMQAVTNAAVSGAGIAWLPYWLVRELLVDGRLKQIQSITSDGIWPIYAIWPRTPHLPLKVRLAVDKLVSDLPERMAVVEAPTHPLK